MCFIFISGLTILFVSNSVTREKIGGVQPGVPGEMKERAKNLLRDLESLLPNPDSTTEKSGPWLMSLPIATALDAHLIVFIARMLDIGNSDIIPERLKEYAARAMNEPAWKNTMQGRKTMAAP